MPSGDTIRPEMVELAKAIHRAMREFNVRNPGRMAKIDSSLSRILILDPDWKPRRSDPGADKRPAKDPSVFTIRDIARRLETTVGALLEERGYEITEADRHRAREAAVFLIEKFALTDGGISAAPVTTLSEDNVLEFVPFKPKLQIIEEEEFHFPVSPDKFKEKDFDYPQPWHYWTNDTPIDELPALAAGPVGVPGLLNPHGANVREVFDRVNQIVRVFGNSMEDRYFDGDLVRVDTRLRNPVDGTPVAVYCEDLGGSLIGFLKREGDHVMLKKKNRDQYPDPVVLPATGWILLGPIVELVSRKERREII